MRKRPTAVNSLTLLLAVMVSVGLAARAQNGTVLKGEVQKGEFVSPGVDRFAPPALSRKDIHPGGDPFASSSDNAGQFIDAPPIKSASVFPPILKKSPFGLGASTERFSGTRLPPTSDRLAGPSRGQPDVAGPAANVSPANDPDNDPAMKIAWDVWHRRVADAIYQRFNFFAPTAFKYSPPLMMRVGYDVTRAGVVENVSVLQHSTNPMFDMLVVQCVKAVSGDQNVLAFPQGSRRMSVDKAGTFTYNCPGMLGFKYTTGDQETVRGR